MSHKFETVAQKVSYGLGRQMAEQVLKNPFDGIDSDGIIAGVTDVLNNVESQIPQQELVEAFQIVGQELEKKRRAEMDKVIQVGEKYLEENKARDGVITLESGLQYEVLNEGSGDKPSASSTVRTHYHGTLTNGEVFDSSYERGQPAEFPVNGVIPGWTEALQLMSVGSKWRLHLPHDLAYGERGAGAKIPPFSVLVFDVELLEIL